MSASEPNITSQESSPGTRLRQARESAGLSLAEIAQRTLIPVARLQSLEKDDYNQVGVPTFVIGYTRTYARILGLDPSPLVQQLEDRLASQTVAKQPPPSVALSLEVRKRPGSIFWPLMWLFLVVLVVVAVMGIGALSILDSSSPSLQPPPATVPVPAPALTPTTLSLEVQTDNPPEVSVQEEEVPDPSARQIIPLQLPSDPTADPDFSAVETPEPDIEMPLAAPSDASPPAELVLNLSDDCWVDVTDATGKRIVARNVASGDNLRLFGQPPFDVILGNAAAVDMTLNGQPVDTNPPPGRKMLRLSVAE